MRLFPETLKYCRLVSTGASLASWGGVASLALVGHPSTAEWWCHNKNALAMPYGVARCFTSTSFVPHLLLLGWLKLNLALLLDQLRLPQGDECWWQNTNSLAASLEPLARRNVAILSLFYRYYFGRCSSELAPGSSSFFSREVYSLF